MKDSARDGSAMIARKVPLRRSTKKGKPTKRTTLRNKADRLFSLLIRQPGFCARCGKTDSLQCSHFISRRYHNVRWNPLNAEVLCASCHKFLTERPIEAHDRAVEQLGEHVYAELRRLARSDLGLPDYRLIVDELSARLKEKRVTPTDKTEEEQKATDLYDPIPALDGTRESYERLAAAISDVASFCESPIDDWMRAGATAIRRARE